MSYTYYQPNPVKKRVVGDCTIRAISKALDQTWHKTYVGLCLEGFRMGDLANSDAVWSTYLYKHGFRRNFIPDDGLGAYTVSDFAKDHPQGTFVLSMPGQHVVCVKDGNWFDAWDSGEETPTYFWGEESGRISPAA